MINYLLSTVNASTFFYFIINKAEETYNCVPSCKCDFPKREMRSTVEKIDYKNVLHP